MYPGGKPGHGNYNNICSFSLSLCQCSCTAVVPLITIYTDNSSSIKPSYNPHSQLHSSPKPSFDPIIIPLETDDVRGIIIYDKTHDAAQLNALFETPYDILPSLRHGSGNAARLCHLDMGSLVFSGMLLQKDPISGYPNLPLILHPNPLCHLGKRRCRTLVTPEPNQLLLIRNYWMTTVYGQLTHLSLMPTSSSSHLENHPIMHLFS